MGRMVDDRSGEVSGASNRLPAGTEIEAPQPGPTSLTFVGRWEKLVSDTNWEKGRILCEWRTAMLAAGAAPYEYSDEAWSRYVGGITGQHVGRLRRVYQRFGATRTTYAGLYWSHFFAALDWDDAEMWLEGAVRNGWSVSRTRRARWETLGAVSAEATEEEVIAAELDEDFEPALQSAPGAAGTAGEPESGPAVPREGELTVPGPVAEHELLDAQTLEPASADGRATATERAPQVRPFAHLPDLPDDVADAFEAFKLAILTHKATGWQDVSRDDLLACLEALKELVLAATDLASPPGRRELA